MQKIIASTATVGAAVAVFWLLAIDAARNGAAWPPDAHSWFAHLTCPLVSFVGISDLWNFLVTVLNGMVYGLITWAILEVRKRARSQ